MEEDLDVIMAEAHPPANYVAKVTFYAAFLTPDTLTFRGFSTKLLRGKIQLGQPDSLSSRQAMPIQKFNQLLILREV